ncbi:PTS glucitol/sorbitol transporter subunit IIA [Acetobacterium carbinolicum]|jgi:PTS system glucitol/sorbitol-specific IIA component|uniref:PTS glucitol/sorbitol transporter subunit IIA n=1 Tax=Acetobacterium TaxID=33951 RepID=UPI000DBEC569|nr:MULTISPECIES: PTS glucitol/sorbitol transporter subunit IIA [unclassified Acetobacterium]AWW26772.1 PTS sorbitol transporter subunit IIA [Acetobacterium sp. KB-1]MDK2941573.1 glucitol/sorbitol system component [Acetobacterium sp.]MDZ5725213.1 PTS glucitol/sorbitol transporter subunit IIA [Acetobacterium sp. K1/6]
MDFTTEITQIGEMVEEFLKEKLLIVFDENAPPELAEIAVLHTKKEFIREVKEGDAVRFGDVVYEVTAVGHEANITLESMGHCSFCFTGEDQVKLPGQIELKGQGIPAVKIGDPFQIIYK